MEEEKPQLDQRTDPNFRHLMDGFQARDWAGEKRLFAIGSP